VDCYIRPSRSSKGQSQAKKMLLELLKNTPVPDDELLENLGLYIRSVYLAKILYCNELYLRILNIPGIVVELGFWRGANLALFEAFRSVYEPYNLTRKVVGFDTLKGYPSISPQDRDSTYVAVGGYAVGEEYENYLTSVLDIHERDNYAPHIKKHEIVKGDVLKTIDQYLSRNPETIIALAYFDLAMYEPTKKCLEAIKPHLVRGSVLAMDELNSHDFPGETLAFREVFGLDRYKMYRSGYLPDRSYVIIE